MKAGFDKVDITPRIGVELFGYGPAKNRIATSIRDRLEARSMALYSNNKKIVIVGCDLGGISDKNVDKAKRLIRNQEPELSNDDILICCSHHHTGPAPDNFLSGFWGRYDDTFERLLPYRIARSAINALETMEEVVFSIGTVPCEGIGINRNYERFSVPHEECLRDDWRPEKPELTDTKTTVAKFTSMTNGKILGFIAYFAAHPVVCGLSTAISGDYPGIAIHNVMKDNPGSIGVFLQGALGDLNSCAVGHDDPQQALKALDVISERFAKAIRNGLNEAKEVSDTTLYSSSFNIKLETLPVKQSLLNDLKAEKEAVLSQSDATDNHEGCMAAAYLCGIEKLTDFYKKYPDGLFPAQIRGIRIGPVSLLGAPFEMFQAIKNDVVARAKSQVPLVVGLADGEYAYATDNNVDQESYAAKLAPALAGLPQYRDAHGQLVKALLDMDKQLLNNSNFK